MPTDPFVAPVLDESPRHEQNLGVGVSVPAPRRWVADRPGDLHGGQPRGDLLGAPGPNVGYALHLAHRAADRLALAPHEHVDDAVSVVGEVAMKRASSFGRAPVIADVECAMLLLGYQGGCAPDFAEWRAVMVTGAHHDYRLRRVLCDAVELDALRLVPSALVERLEPRRRELRSNVEAAPIAP
ncbi:MAG TPA: hypothetical protein VMX12_04825 [Acidimicrobiia bacterium]|nr:hypothetical protein [Acidimicrobiia bacterium]